MTAFEARSRVGPQESCSFRERCCLHIRDAAARTFLPDCGESESMSDASRLFPAATVERRIEFGDTDNSGRYHFSTALKLFEAAECELMLELGLLDTIYTSMPRAGLKVNYRAVLRFMDEVRVTARVVNLGRTSIRFGFDVYRDEELCLDGEITAVYVDDEGRPQPWGEEHRRLFAPQV